MLDSWGLPCTLSSCPTRDQSPSHRYGLKSIHPDAQSRAGASLALIGVAWESNDVYVCPMIRHIKSSFRPILILFSLLVIAAGCPQTEPEAPAAPEPPAEAEPSAEEAQAEPAAAESDPEEAAPADDPENGDASAEADASSDEDEAEPEDQKELTDVSGMEELVQCMKEAGVVIYGAVTCPFCPRLADAFGGAVVVSPIYVECTQDGERCRSEMKGRGVPEIQVRGELYRGSREPAEMGRAVGCNLVE